MLQTGRETWTHVIQTGRERQPPVRMMAVGGKAVVELCRRSLLAEEGMSHSNVSMDG